MRKILPGMRDLQTLTIVFRGGGDLATGTGVRLYRAGLRRLVFLEIPQPLAVRRTVSFSEAVYLGRCAVEGITAVLARSPDDAPALWEQGAVPVLVDPGGASLSALKPEVLVEATLSKRNIGVSMDDAPLVIGLGPGFTAGRDVHAVAESNRGISMGRLLRQGAAEPDTGIPGTVMGYDRERVLRAPCGGLFETGMDIGDAVRPGDRVGSVDGTPVRARIGGFLRGLLRSGLRVEKGVKLGDVEPRPGVGFLQVSDKGLALGGAVLEAILAWKLSGDPRDAQGERNFPC
jgi:xanthine dehydrogenase accessory factor